MALIEITFEDSDVLSIAREVGIDDAVALERADSWAKAITETAVTLINEQLASVIEHDNP